MTEAELVVRNRHVLVSTQRDAATDTVSLVISVDSYVVWSSQEPNGQAIKYGVNGDVFYAWSARRLIQVELSALGTGPNSIETTEDILTVFRRDSTWLIVTETRVEVHDATGLAQMVEMPEVVASADVREGQLTIRLFGGNVVQLEVRPQRSGGLRLIAPSE